LGSKLNSVGSYYTSADFDALIASDIIPWQSDYGKFVGLFFGEATVNFKDNTTINSVSPIHIVAAVIAQLQVSDTIIYKKLPNAVSLTGQNMTAAQLEALSQLGVNCLTRTALGKRGRPFEVVSATDNTLATFGSDYWSLGQMRLMMLVIERIRALGRRYLGSIGYNSMKNDVKQFLDTLTHELMIRDYTLNINRSSDQLTATIDVGIRPYFGLRTISFSTQVQS
jgi:hypothetical protein